MLTPEMRNLLAKASVVAEAPASGALDSAPGIAHMKPGTVEPRSNGMSLLELMAIRFHEAHTTQDIGEALLWAEKALESTKVNPGPAKGLREVGSVPWRREIAQEASKAKGDEIVVIARRYSVSRATVYRYRDQYAA